MANTKFIGEYKNLEGKAYQIIVYCAGFIQALYLLPLNITITDKNYQLNIISNNVGETMNITQ